MGLATLGSPTGRSLQTRTDARPSSPGPGLAAGLVLLGLLLVGAVAAGVLGGWDPTGIDPLANLAPPSAEHPLGTDRNGMDIWSRLLYAARIDLAVALAAVALAVLVGGSLGAIVGYAGGWVDELSLRAVDVFQAFPTFALALAVAVALGPGLLNLVAVVALVNAPAYLRLLRAEVRSAREHAYVEAARGAGHDAPDILVHQLLPNCLNPILVIAPLNIGWAMLTLAGLSFLGLGVPVPEAEWGAMISTGAPDIVAGRWWTSLFPGLALFSSVLACNLVSEGLRNQASHRVD